MRTMDDAMRRWRAAFLFHICGISTPSAARNTPRGLTLFRSARRNVSPCLHDVNAPLAPAFGILP